jgi:hypothetical protein
MTRALDKRLRKLEARGRKSELENVTDEDLAADILRLADQCGVLDAFGAWLADIYDADTARQMMAQLRWDMNRKQASDHS